MNLPVLSEALREELRLYLAANYIEQRPALLHAKAANRRADAFVCAETAMEDSAAPEPQWTFAAPKAAAKRAESFDDVFRQQESSFSEHLLSLLDECGEKDSAVYKRAEVSRQLFHKILNRKDYQPTKSTAIQLALGLRLDLAGTQTLLKKAGYSLTRSSKADLVVQYFIERKEFDIPTINAALYDCGLPLLKTGSVR